MKSSEVHNTYTPLVETRYSSGESAAGSDRGVCINPYIGLFNALLLFRFSEISSLVGPISFPWQFPFPPSQLIPKDIKI